jgi:hypothetical protein
MQKERLRKILSEDTPFPLKDVLKMLIEAAEILLHEKDYDGDNHEEYLTAMNKAKEIEKLLREDEMEQTLEDVVKNRGSKNHGMFHERIAENAANVKRNWNQTEGAFIENWTVGSGSYAKRLGQLFMNARIKERFKITNRDRFVAATVIQWLGSNCGMAFMKEALGKCGFEIVKREDQK